MTGAATHSVGVDFLVSFCDAFNRHDLDALMDHMTEDCVFDASAGSQQEGHRYVGRDAVRAGFADVFTNFPDSQWEEGRHLVAGDRGVSAWVFRGTRLDGTRVEVNGCDLFTFRDGKIAVKDSYRKQRSQ
ncbi:MAG: nuclear transport factor 2 family protein [Chloroflexota bacterium]